LKNPRDITVLIAARNAAATIERAVRSCVAERVPVLLIDDHSTDDTINIARDAGKGWLSVVQAPYPGGVAIARQAGLDAVESPFAAWVDADDAWMPGRADRLLRKLRAGADIVADSIELYDGVSGYFLRLLEVPDFLLRDPQPMRLFERNYLPGDTQVAFNVATFRNAGGYDPTLFGPESFDLLLRALLMGARFAYCHEAGYRMYAYAGSVSRDIDRQRCAVKTTLRKHPYAIVREQCNAAAYPRSVTAWILASMAMYRDDPVAAIEFIDQACSSNVALDLVLEPDGPCPMPERWRRAFMRGTAFLALQRADEAALGELNIADRLISTAETANNLGVALRRLKQPERASKCFLRALACYPGYRDAILNLKYPEQALVTTHPLRRHASRLEYEPR
jgi:hypothetical protein